jgi:hypothetical protein
MSRVDLATFRVLAGYQGVDRHLDEARLAAAVTTHLAMREGMVALRSRELPFVGTVPEPADALAWIEAGGESP